MGVALLVQKCGNLLQFHIIFYFLGNGVAQSVPTHLCLFLQLQNNHCNLLKQSLINGYSTGLSVPQIHVQLEPQERDLI